MSGLPSDWTQTTLSEIAAWGSGGTPSRSEPSYYGGGIPWIKTGELGPRFVSSTEESISEEGLSKSSAKLFPAGSVAIAMYGATIGKTSILGIQATTNQACAVGIPHIEATTKEYLYHFLCSQKEAFVEAGKGGAQPNISQAIIKDWNLPLAPLPEQKRIADKLDSVLARVDACRDRLDRLPALLKRFRQSILAAATSGQLTEDWREQNVIGNESWNYPMIGDLVSIKNGRAFPSADYADEGVRLIRPGNLHHSGSVQWCAKNTTHLPESYAREFPTFVLGKGELLMNLTAQSLKDDFLGRVCLKTDSIPALLNQRICAFYSKSSSDIRPYLFVYFKSPIFRSYVDTLDSGTLIKHMHTKQLLSHVIPVPTENEQTEIVRRVELLFAFADRLEARLATARRQVGQLTPALLAKAFRGELVAQDPADEPAADLLKRLAAQREVAPKAKRGRAKA